MFDRDSSSVVRSLIGLFGFRGNQVSKVYQHRSRNGGMLKLESSLVDGEFEIYASRVIQWYGLIHET